MLSMMDTADLGFPIAQDQRCGTSPSLFLDRPRTRLTLLPPFRSQLYDATKTDPLYKQLPFLLIIPSPNHVEAGGSFDASRLLSFSLHSSPQPLTFLFPLLFGPAPPPLVQGAFTPSNGVGVWDLGCESYSNLSPRLLSTRRHLVVSSTHATGHLFSSQASTTTLSATSKSSPRSKDPSILSSRGERPDRRSKTVGETSSKVEDRTSFSVGSGWATSLQR